MGASPANDTKKRDAWMGVFLLWVDKYREVG